MTKPKHKTTPKLADHYDHPFEKLVDVMAALRDPNGGCPWDLEQDFSTIAPYTLEEAYEVADAIDRGDMNDLREELGDLLLQPVYHAQMAAEAGHFTITDVLNDITEKMISRHPHVFENRTANTASDVNKIWDEKKALEKPQNVDDSALGGITRGLPSLLLAQKLTKKAAKVGFEWPDTNRVLDKLEEEIAELREAAESGRSEDIMDELGDMLFVLANYGRMLGINAEEALRQANNKFERRFRGLEIEIKAKHKDMRSATLEQMEQAWNNQKLKERGQKS